MTSLTQTVGLLSALLLALSLAGCATTNETEGTTAEPMVWPSEPVTEEVAFTSGNFEIVGDLVLPGGEGPYPAVIAVHGSGPHTRKSTPGTAAGQVDRFCGCEILIFVANWISKPPR